MSETMTEENLNKIVKFAPALVVLVIGSLFMAEAIVNSVNGTVLFFADVNRGFEFVIGFVFVVLAATLIPRKS